MGLRAGSALEMTFEAGLLTFAVPSVMQPCVDAQGRVFFTGPADATVLSDDAVRATLESVRR